MLDLFSTIDFTSVTELHVAPHKNGADFTVSFDTGDEARVQLVVSGEVLPQEFHREGLYRRRGGKWQRVVRVDGANAVNILKALLG
jgi:hypothetical protein